MSDASDESTLIPSDYKDALDSKAAEDSTAVVAGNRQDERGLCTSAYQETVRRPPRELTNKFDRVFCRARHFFQRAVDPALKNAYLENVSNS